MAVSSLLPAFYVCPAGMNSPNPRDEGAQRRTVAPIACLTRAYNLGITVCMRTTLNIDDSLLAQAGEYTGETEKTALVRMGLEALIQRESARRLAALGGTMPSLTVPPRRRPETKRRK
jgi:Arc/MetJ family transcription regulator